MKKILLALVLLVFSTFSQENYVIIKSKNVNIYDGLSTDSAIVTKISSGKKLELIEYDESYAKIMYLDKNGLDQVGYIKRNEVYVRETNTEKAISKIESLNNFIIKKTSEKKQLVTTTSYSYSQSTEGSKDIPDSEGQRVANALKFYKSPSTKAKWIYLGDNSIVAIEGQEKEYIKVSIPEKEGFYYIKKSLFKYSKNTKLNGLVQKIIVVDRLNQNTQLFDFSNKNFVLTKVSKSTTGYDNSNNSYKTPVGYFLVSNVKPFMMYYLDPTKDEEEKMLGRAQYAVRFSGGYYLHGIPVSDELKGKERESALARVASKLGTHPSSHGCVRNSDENAKFIYDWTNPIKQKNGNFIPKNPVAVIVME
mgnify:FL=1